MSISVPAITAKQDFLTSFQQSLNIPLNSLSDIKNWQMYVENIVDCRVISPIRRDCYLLKKAQLVQDLFNHPKVTGSRVNIYVLQSLRDEMKGFLQQKIKHLKVLSFCSQLLSKIKPYQEEAFLKTISLKFQELKELGHPEKKALSSALAYAISRSMIDPDKIQDCEALRPYRCPITSRVILSNAVYLKTRKPDDKNPYERYEEDAITQWLAISNKNPISNEKALLTDICKDAKAQTEVESILCDYLYPRSKEITEIPSLGSLNPSEILFSAALLAYPIIKDLFDSENIGVVDVCKWGSLAIDLFTPYLDQVDSIDLQGGIYDIKMFAEPKETNAQQDSWDFGFSTPEYSSKSTCKLTEEKTRFMQEFLKNEILKGTASEPIEELLRLKLESKMQQYIAFFEEIEKLELSSAEKTKFQAKGIKSVLEQSTINDEEFSNRRKRRLASTSTSDIGIQTLESLLESAIEKSENSSIIKARRMSSQSEACQIDLLNRFFSKKT